MLAQYPAWAFLPEAHEVIFNLMRRYKAIALGRVIIARLPMGGTIKPHADNYGDYALQDGGMRFHAAVNAAPGCLFHCGGETIQTRTGEVWWFNHQAEHSAENNSADDRVHLLIDMATG
jgi:aspartyl/asparaginyl beta-hydroxylase (cupin superfamily)